MLSSHSSAESTGSFVVIEGIDGSGKDTLAENTVRELVTLGYSCSLVDKKWSHSESEFVADQLQQLKQMLFARTENRSILEMDPHYWMLLTAAWFTSLYSNTIDELLKNRTIVVTNGWYYKVMARFAIKGCSIEWMRNVFSPIPSPDLVVLLDEEPAKVWRRRPAFSNIELGRLDGYDGNPRVTFIEYQQRVREVLLDFGKEGRWYRILGNESAAATIKERTDMTVRLIIETLPRDFGTTLKQCDP